MVGMLISILLIKQILTMVGKLKQDNPVTRRDELESFVLRHLKLAKKPLSEQELVTRIYSEYNEILSSYVMIRLRNKGLIIFINNKWTIKG